MCNSSLYNAATSISHHRWISLCFEIFRIKSMIPFPIYICKCKLQKR